MPLMYGLPVPEARLAAEDGALALGGCFEPEDGRYSTWQCPQLHRWYEPDESRWQARLLEVLVRYGYRDEPAE